MIVRAFYTGWKFPEIFPIPVSYSNHIVIFQLSIVKLRFFIFYPYKLPIKILIPSEADLSTNLHEFSRITHPRRIDLCKFVDRICERKFLNLKKSNLFSPRKVLLHVKYYKFPGYSLTRKTGIILAYHLFVKLYPFD